MIFYLFVINVHVYVDYSLNCSHYLKQHTRIMQSNIFSRTISGNKKSGNLCWMKTLSAMPTLTGKITTVDFQSSYMFWFNLQGDLLMEREFNTTRITNKLYYTYCLHGTYKLSVSEFKTVRIIPILKSAKIWHRKI